MVETLVATAIVTVAMMGSVGIFFSVSNLSDKTAEGSVVSSLVRRTIEEAKNKGFANLPEGTTTKYDDMYGAGDHTTKTAADRYMVTMSVTSDVITAGVPDKTALRTVIVTVKRVSDNSTLETTGTYLAWGGP